MILNMALAPLETTAFKIGEAIPTIGGLCLLVGGLMALIRIHRAELAPPVGSRTKQVATVCVAIGGLIMLGSLNQVLTSISFEPERRIVIAETAGGAQRVQLDPQYTASLEQERAASSKDGLDFQYGGYAHPKGGDAVVLFIGANHKNSEPRRAITVIFTGIAKGSGEQEPKLTEFPAGELGGEVRCASGSEVRCAWADRSTYGAVTATDITEAELAALLVRMRTDLEQKK